MENQVNNEEQDKPTLSQAREYLSELLNIAGSRPEGQAVKVEYSPRDIIKRYLKPWDMVTKDETNLQ